MLNKRILNWDGCKNTRDLGGLKASSGQTTRWKSLVRSDSPTKLDPIGWNALNDYGIRTIISLRTKGKVNEYDFRNKNIPPEINFVSIDIEDLADKEFKALWVDTGLWCTPLYYQDALRRWPERHAHIIEAFSNAKPGGVLIHCARGHDRTGIASILLLTLAGVSMESIIEDYELSLDPVRDEILSKRNTSNSIVIQNALKVINIEKYLLNAGLSPKVIQKAKLRLSQQS